MKSKLKILIKPILVLCIVVVLVLGTYVKDTYVKKDWTYSFKITTGRVHKVVDMKIIMQEVKAKKITPPVGYTLDRISVNYNSNDPRNITIITCHYKKPNDLKSRRTRR